MSADNGVYIGKFADGYRVIYAAAIENTLYDPKIPKLLTDAYIVEYYGNSRVFSSEDAAWEWAAGLAASCGGYTEYGINELTYGDFPPITLEEARKIVDNYFKDGK